MKTAHNAMRWMAVLLVGACMAIPAVAASPEELLDQAVELFGDGKYERSQEVLLQIDRNLLPADRRGQRDELAEEVKTAVNQSGKAAHDLDDAVAAWEKKDLATAEKAYQAVIDNKYAGEAQKRKAAEGLELIKKQRELTGKIEAPKVTTRPAPETKATTTSPAEDLRKARQERARIEAAVKIKAGEEATAKGQYDLAEQHFEEALKLVPNHPAAIRGREIVQQHRSVEGKPNLIDEVAKLRQLRWSRTARRFEEGVREVSRLVNERRYPDARLRATETQQLLEAGKQDASPASEYENLKRQLDGLSRLIDTEEQDALEAAAMEQRRATLEQERARERRVEKDKMERINELFNQAQQLSRQKEYDKAAELLRTAIAIDPTYQNAQWQLEVLQDAGLIQVEKDDRRKFLDKVQQALLQAELAKTPAAIAENDNIIAFPDEERWRMITSREPYGVDGAGAETEADRVAHKALSKPLPADLQFIPGTSLRQAIERLKEAGKIAINVSWNTLSAVGVDPDGTDVGDLNLGGIKLETALTMVLDTAGGPLGIELGYDVMEGIIIVSTVEDLNRKTEIRVYDIRDLLLQIRSLQAMGGGMGGMMGGMGGMMGGMGGMMGGMGGMMGGMGGMGGMMGGMGGMGGMMGGMGGYGMGGMGGMGGGYGMGGMGGGYGQGGDQTEDIGEEEREERITALQDLIKKLVMPGTWEDEGAENIGSLDVWNERLIVRHTRAAHRQLRELFKQLREAKDLQVAVEARFMTLSNNFLEQIGVDIDVILNQGNAGLDQALTSTGGFASPALNPVTGMTLLQSRQNTRYGFLPAPVAAGVPLTQTGGWAQPFGAAGLVPQGSPENWWDRHTTAVPLVNNTMSLAAPRPTGVPGGLDANTLPAFQMFGSFLDNIQVDFLLRATQMDVRGSLVDAPRLTVYSGRQADLNVSTSVSYVAYPGQLPVGGTGINGQAALGRSPGIGQYPQGRLLRVTPTVSADRRYVTLELQPYISTVEFEIWQDATGPLQLPRYSSTSIGTTVTVPDRGWLLLGGLNQAGETEAEAGVPILSKIPILKRAYTNRSRVKDERTLLILVKPTIVIQGETEEEAFPNLVSSNQTVSGG